MEAEEFGTRIRALAERLDRVEAEADPGARDLDEVEQIARGLADLDEEARAAGLLDDPPPDPG